MNKTKQFSEKATYVSPSVKSVELKLEGLLCQSNGYGDVGKAGRALGYDSERDNYGEF